MKKNALVILETMKLKRFYSLIKRVIGFLLYKKIDATVHFTGRKYIMIGKNTLISQNTWMNINKRYREKHIIIGDYCFIGRNNFFTSGDLITLGDYVMTSVNCCFIGADHNMENPCIPYYFAETRCNRTINVGCNVFIGASATLIGDVDIGYGSRVGANALIVNKKYPPFSLIIGNPGKIIKRFSFADKNWKDINYWDNDDEQLIPSSTEYNKIIANNNCNKDLPYKAIGKTNGNLYA